MQHFFFLLHFPTQWKKENSELGHQRAKNISFFPFRICGGACMLCVQVVALSPVVAFPSFSPSSFPFAQNLSLVMGFWRGEVNCCSLAWVVRKNATGWGNDKFLTILHFSYVFKKTGKERMCVFDKNEKLGTTPSLFLQCVLSLCLVHAHTLLLPTTLGDKKHGKCGNLFPTFEYILNTL